jgi:hypothetical protein
MYYNFDGMNLLIHKNKVLFYPMLIISITKVINSLNFILKIFKPLEKLWTLIIQHPITEDIYKNKT